MASDFRWNPSFFEELGRSSQIVSAVQQKANDIAATVRSSAPRDSGDFIRSVHTERVEHRDRSAVYVVADADHALAVEARTGVMARAAARFKG